MRRFSLFCVMALVAGSMPLHAQELMTGDNEPGCEQNGGPKPCKPGQDKPDQNEKDKPNQGGKDRPDQCDHEQHGRGGKKKCHDDERNVRIERFNVVCYYKDKGNPEGYQACKASALFDKTVTLDGGEVVDNSPDPEELFTPPQHSDPRWQIPYFKVECDNTTRYGGDRGRRFTDILSTRIVALTGPKPAIYLPRGALHAGYHVSESYLEIDTGVPHNKTLRTAGQCYIWTGKP